MDLAWILHRVGVFLREDGKYKQAEKLLANARDICNAINGSEDSNTLAIISDLAWTYDVEGLWKDAATLREKVYNVRRNVLGEEHPDTLRRWQISRSHIGIRDNGMRR